MGYDIAKDLILPEAERALANIKSLFATFTTKVQGELKKSASRGALMMAIKAKQSLDDIEGALTEALDELEESHKDINKEDGGSNEGPKP